MYNGKCILSVFKCDLNGDDDCGDNSDERGCGSMLYEIYGSLSLTTVSDMHTRNIFSLNTHYLCSNYLVYVIHISPHFSVDKSLIIGLSVGLSQLLLVVTLMALSLSLACYYNKKRLSSSSPEAPTSVKVSVESPEYELQPVDDHTEFSAQNDLPSLPDGETGVHTLQKEHEERI